MFQRNSLCVSEKLQFVWWEVYSVAKLKKDRKSLSPGVVVSYLSINRVRKGVEGLSSFSCLVAHRGTGSNPSPSCTLKVVSTFDLENL